MLPVAKATSVLRVNVIVCNAAAIMLLLLCVNVVYICIYYCMECCFSKRRHYAVV